MLLKHLNLCGSRKNHNFLLSIMWGGRQHFAFGIITASHVCFFHHFLGTIMEANGTRETLAVAICLSPGGQIWT